MPILQGVFRTREQAYEDMSLYNNQIKINYISCFSHIVLELLQTKRKVARSANAVVHVIVVVREALYFLLSARLVALLKLSARLH